MAALFLAQALYILARVVELSRSAPVGSLATTLAAAALPALTAMGLLRMRKWGRNLAMVMCSVMIVGALLMRAAGARPAAVIPIMLIAGGIIVYLASSPARNRFN